METTTARTDRLPDDALAHVLEQPLGDQSQDQAARILSRILAPASDAQSAEVALFGSAI